MVYLNNYTATCARSQLFEHVAKHIRESNLSYEQKNKTVGIRAFDLQFD